MYNTRMSSYKSITARERKLARRFQQRFVDKAGPNLVLLKDMLDQTDYGMYVKDLDRRLVMLNRKNCEWCNFQDELDVVGRRTDELFPREPSADYTIRDIEVAKTGKPVLNDISARPPDYDTGFIVRSVFPVKDQKGKVIGTACVYKKVADADVEGDWRIRMKSVLSWIDAHYAERIATAQLARQVGVSESQFRRIFANMFSMSPTHYVNVIRINAARTLLETSDMLVADIATETGFYDQSHFTKLFVRERGMTPGEYRRRHHQ